MRRALVTGSAGFVGHRFCRRLANEGWPVLGIDLQPSTRGNPRNNNVNAVADCRNFFGGDQTATLVVHCAAIVGGRAKIEGAPMSVADNLSIDALFWQWVLRTRPERVVYFSSSAAYPVILQDIGAEDGGYLLHEDDIDLERIDHPDQTYGLAKLVGEVQAELVRNEGVPVTVVRTFSGYGEDQSTDYPFPSFIQRATDRLDPFPIWGDGQQVRDWIHIDDIVDAVLTMVDHGIDGPANLCTGRPTSFDDLARIVCETAGYQPELAHDTSAPTGVRYRVGDPTLMRSFYEPRISLEEGVARALRSRMAA